MILRIIFSISHLCGPSPDFLVRVPFLSVLCPPSLPTFKIPLVSSGKQVTRSGSWFLVPEQTVQQPRTLAVSDGGVLRPLASLRSESYQQPWLTCPCIYSASFKLLPLRLRSSQSAFYSIAHPVGTWPFWFPVTNELACNLACLPLTPRGWCACIWMGNTFPFFPLGVMGFRITRWHTKFFLAREVIQL